MGATAAIVMHYGGNDWSRAQINGLQTQFAAMGIEVIAVTDAGFKPEKQVSDLETIMAQSPDIIVSIPTDPTATASRLSRRRRGRGEAGVHGQRARRLRGRAGLCLGRVGGQLWQRRRRGASDGQGAWNGGGEIGLVFHAADFFVTKQRYDAFKATIASDYPGIVIVDEQGIGGPDFSGDAERPRARC
jgi:ribose transport system substrate-binding protein